MVRPAQKTQNLINSIELSLKLKFASYGAHKTGPKEPMLIEPVFEGSYCIIYFYNLLFTFHLFYPWNCLYF
uniref:Uncharacterized protein n=1 Tax=Picea glauca TaxID=3330 RepID=A0A117NFI9_PICGL|nr:hypothetical protein ABT39_MTgene3481 [Picea glauca]